MKEGTHVVAAPVSRPEIWTPGGRRLIKILSFILILTVGLLLRLNPLFDWLAQPVFAFFQGEPLLNTFDGYYYLRLARDLLEGSYGAVDTLRAVPQFPPMPFPPPLLSVLAAVVTALTPLSLNWTGVLLPAFLGVLLAFPMYGLGKHFGGTFMGLSAALVSMVSPYYIQRSGLGWFDTDCLLVTLVTTATWCFLKFAVVSGRQRFLYLAAGLATSLATVWWWDQTPQIALLVTLSPLLVALLLYERPAGSEWRWLGGILGLYLLILMNWLGWRFPLDIAHQVVMQFGYISKQTQGDFPNIGVSVAEQARLPWLDIVRQTLGTPLILLLAVIGLIWLFISRPKDSALLLVLLGLSGLGLVFAGRFLIYVAPVVGLGIGYLASRIWYLGGGGRPLMVLVAPALVVAASIPGYLQMLTVPRFPHESPAVVAGMDRINQDVEPDAVIWAWWDHGYPLNYWARRATVNDGQVHGGERSVYNALPLVTSSGRLAANFMRFYVAHGLSGVHAFYDVAGGPVKGYELLLRALHSTPLEAGHLLASAGLKDIDRWLRFLFPQQTRPIYLFLDWRLTRISYWWYWLGSWDNAERQGIHPYHHVFLDVEAKQGGLKSPAVTVDLEAGTVLLDGHSLPIRSFHSDSDELDSRDFGHPGGVNVDYGSEKRMLVVSDGYFSRSVFNKLFTYGQTGQQRYLEVVTDQSPAFQIIRVSADRYVPGSWRGPQ